jgi:2-haloacid dehalogenase/putative hydrolase of the HAD superfamily
MPNAVLWDFGNVIVRWNPRTLYEKIFPDPVQCDRFLSEVCTLEWHAPTDCGVTFTENCARLIAFHSDHETEILALRDRWN